MRARGKTKEHLAMANIAVPHTHPNGTSRLAELDALPGPLVRFTKSGPDTNAIADNS